MLYEVVDPHTTNPIALLDLCCSNGLQEGLSPAVAVLLDERAGTLAAATAHGFRSCTILDTFKDYLQQDILALHEQDPS